MKKKERIIDFFYFRKNLFFAVPPAIIFTSILYILFRFTSISSAFILSSFDAIISINASFIGIDVALLAIFLAIPFGVKAKAYIEKKRYNRVIPFSIISNIFVSTIAVFFLLFSNNIAIRWIGVFFSLLSVFSFILIAIEFYFIAINHNK